MSNNKHVYNIPLIIKMIGQCNTYRQIANSEAVTPSGCSISRISEINKLIEYGEIYFKGVGTLKYLKQKKSLNTPPDPPESKKPPERNYDQICYDIISEFMSLKSTVPGYILKDDLKKAYLILSKVIHPDLNKRDPKAQKKFIALKNAHDYIEKKYFSGEN